MNSCPNCDGELWCGWCGEPVPAPAFGTPGCAGGVCAERAEAALAALLVAAEKVVTAGMVYTATRPPDHHGLAELIAAGNELSKRACEARAALREAKP
jgi:hypothetical protein